MSAVPFRAGRRRGRRSGRRRIVVALLLGAFAVVAYSYTTTMLRPSSLPLGVRSVEWVRANGGAWFVDSVERWYYEWRAPKRGGPTIRALPRVGLRPAAGARAARAFEPSPVLPAIRPALPFEGAWRSVGPSVGGRPPILVTTFRSDRAYPRVVAYVAWLDHTRTQLALYPGRYEPPSSAPRGPMMVPWGQRWRLLAVFNSGFTYRDGHGGFALDGRVFTPLRQGAGTLVAYRNGRVDVVAWRGGPAPARNVVLARQNLPLIVQAGRPSSALNDTAAWGATLGNAVRVWRSGVGVDRHGDLVYAAADYQTVGSLAGILIRAGAVRAIELDINTEWPTFNTFARFGGRDAAKLVPNPLQSAQRYLVPDDRDFFAVLKRLPNGSPLVPLP
ncbi:MAG: phosphodiester glycosidase family protein [Gaiellaceae bacterium]